MEADRSWWVAWTSNPVCAVVILRWVSSILTRFRHIKQGNTGTSENGVVGYIIIVNKWGDKAVNAKSRLFPLPFVV